MNVYKHIVYNPHLESIEAVCNRLGGSNVWALNHIVPVNEWCHVAVFESWDGELSEMLVFGKMPVVAKGETLQPATVKPSKIEVVASPRQDWCGACKAVHGYDCPKDKLTK